MIAALPFNATCEPQQSAQEQWQIDSPNRPETYATDLYMIANQTKRASLEARMPPCHPISEAQARARAKLMALNTMIGGGQSSSKVLKTAQGAQD